MKLFRWLREAVWWVGELVTPVPETEEERLRRLERKAQERREELRRQGKL